MRRRPRALATAPEAGFMLGAIGLGSAYASGAGAWGAVVTGLAAGGAAAWAQQRTRRRRAVSAR